MTTQHQKITTSIVASFGIFLGFFWAQTASACAVFNMTGTSNIVGSVATFTIEGNFEANSGVLAVTFASGGGTIGLNAAGNATQQMTDPVVLATVGTMTSVFTPAGFLPCAGVPFEVISATPPPTPAATAAIPPAPPDPIRDIPSASAATATTNWSKRFTAIESSYVIHTRSLDDLFSETIGFLISGFRTSCDPCEAARAAQAAGKSATEALAAYNTAANQCKESNSATAS